MNEQYMDDRGESGIAGASYARGRPTNPARCETAS